MLERGLELVPLRVLNVHGLTSLKRLIGSVEDNAVLVDVLERSQQDRRGQQGAERKGKNDVGERKEGESTSWVSLGTFATPWQRSAK